jgi:branched-chain amino acid transport system permease protein
MNNASAVRWAIIGVLSAGLAVLLALVPFVGGSYYAHVGILVFLNITLVMGYRLLCIAGLYSFCQITFYGIGAYTSALLSSRLGWPVWICFLSAGLVAALFSIGLILPAARVRGVYFFLVTFGFLEVMNAVFLHWSSLTGGDAGVLVSAPLIGTGTQTQDYFVILAFAVVTILVMYRIERSRFGRELAPIGSAEGLAAVSGINVLNNRVLAFAIGAGFAGFAGSLFAHDAAYISSNDFSMWGTIYILVWLVVGGPRKMWGPIVGAVAMTLIAELLRMSGILQALFYAGVLLVVVMAMPQGIVGFVDTVRARIGRGTPPVSEPQPTEAASEPQPTEGLVEGSR